MAFIDPSPPGNDPVELLPPRRNPASAFDDGPRVDRWTASHPRSNGLMLASGIMVALLISGWVTFSSGKFETGSATSTLSSSKTQPPIAPTTSPSPSTTTGQAPTQ
jgi:hypothetical protein